MRSIIASSRRNLDDLFSHVTGTPEECPEATPPRPPLRFGGYALDLDACTLANAQGSEIRLTRAEFVVLQEFLRHRGRMLSRDHLSRALSGRPCESFERGIDMLIVRLRRKIEADPKRPSLILTVPGFGYKLAAEPRATLRLPAVSVPAVEVPLIAASPFANLSGDPSQDRIAEALSREVATTLATFPSVRVVAVADRRAEPAPGARYALTGGVIREGARLRVMVQFTDAASGEQVWARRYGDDDGADAHRSYIAESIANALAGSEGIVINDEGRRAWHKSSSELTEYDHFARGQALRFRRNREDYALLRETWREGLARFPGSALLKTVLAFTYLNEVEVLLSHDPQTNVRRAWDLAAEAEHAACMSPFVSMLHSWLMAALCQWRGEDFDRSIALARLAVRMAPYHVRARSHLAFYLANAGRLDEAIEWARWAIRHQPRHGFGCSLAWAYYLAGRHEEALATLEEVGTEYTPQLAAVYVRLGRLAEARTAVASWLKSFPNVSIARLGLEPIREPLKQRWLADLRAAGFPES